MIRISQLKLHLGHTKEELVQKLSKELRIPSKEILSYRIQRQSIDARNKKDIKYVYTIDAELKSEKSVLSKSHKPNISQVNEVTYEFPHFGKQAMRRRPIIIGSGPAGLFCGYLLAEHGYRPIIYERGSSVEERVEDIKNFWETGVLNPESNVQFGEGGAGTFSDGKLNTLVKDVSGRNKKVLEIFVSNGAPKEILYQNKPHIGTDILLQVVKNMRNRIIQWGGDFYFHHKFTDFVCENGQLSKINIQTGEQEQLIDAETLVLAIGHSARDTFSMLYEKNLPLSAKPFAVGVRVEHAQSMINNSQYGQEHSKLLPAASYKVTANLKNGRGVYSFCMCPGGYVVNASSEDGHLAINGMSYHARDGKNANSAIVVTVSPEDFGSTHPLAGMHFQRSLEKKAFAIGNGKIPVQRFEDFCQNEETIELKTMTPQMKGNYCFGNLHEIFPREIAASIEEGMFTFDKMIQGFAHPDTLLSGVESRTSSPIRIERNDSMQIESTGIYPCGEGAGYAGGITSAAMDGIKIAEKIAEKFSPFDLP